MGLNQRPQSHLAILLSTPPQHLNVRTIVSLSRAALSKGHRVSLFLLSDGIYNALPGPADSPASALEELIGEGLDVRICSFSALGRGIGAEDVIDGLTFGSLFDFSVMVRECDRFLCFGR